MSFLYRFIPSKVHNRIVTFVYDMTTFIGVSKKASLSHYENNVAALRRTLRMSDNGFIENQAQLDGILFGRTSDFSKAGCGVIAVCNAKRALGEEVNAKKAASITRALERKGAALGGKIGISPLALVRYLRRNGYDVKTFFTKDVRRVNLRGKGFDTFIVSCYNNEGNIGDKIHTVNIEKRPDGFVIHNAYRYHATADRYTESEVYPSLADAVIHIDPVYPSQPIMIAGIRKKSPKE